MTTLDGKNIQHTYSSFLETRKCQKNTWHSQSAIHNFCLMFVNVRTRLPLTTENLWERSYPGPSSSTHLLSPDHLGKNEALCLFRLLLKTKILTPGRFFVYCAESLTYASTRRVTISRKDISSMDVMSTEACSSYGNLQMDQRNSNSKRSSSTVGRKHQGTRKGRQL